MTAAMSISKLDGGEYADVLDCGDGTVVKAYLRKPHTARPVEHWPSHEAFIRALCSNEAAAYERLQAEEALLPFVPTYLVRCSPPVAGGMTADKYVVGCGIRLEKLLGRPVKFLRLDAAVRETVEPILWEICETIEPGNVWDCSCFVPGPRASFAIIDFALWDGHLTYSTILKEQGFFTDTQLRFLEGVGA